MIVCQACGYDNPLGRVFCQKCGTKLDLSKVRPPGAADGKGDGVTVGVRKEGRSRGKQIFRTAVRIFDVVLVVVVAYCLFQIWQEPPVPNIPDSAAEAGRVRAMREKLEFAMSAKTHLKVTLSDVQLNSYLAAISDLGKSSDTAAFRTEKIVLQPEQDLVTIYYVRQIVLGNWKKNIVMQLSGRPLADGGQFRFQRVSGRIGGLGVPSFALGALERNYARLFEDFDRERELLGRMTQIQVEPKKVTLHYEPAG